MVNNNPTRRAEPENKVTYLSCIMCYNLLPDWFLLLLVYMQGSLCSKQDSL